MKFSVKAAAALALSAIFLAACEEETPYTVHSAVQIGDHVLPACVARDGTTVRYVTNNSSGSAYAYHMIPGIRPPGNDVPSEPGPYIVLPAPFSALLKNNMLKFVVAHECAHHMLGHAEDGNFAGDNIELMRTFEAEADCAAVQIMRLKYGMTDKEIVDATSGFFRFLAADANNDPTVHGGATERHARTLSCL